MEDRDTMRRWDCPRCGPLSYRTERPLDDALMVARRATFDPGKFTKRVRYSEGEMETLERWQARAVLVALADLNRDPRWGSTMVPHITDYERAELLRLLP